MHISWEKDWNDKWTTRIGSGRESIPAIMKALSHFMSGELVIHGELRRYLEFRLKEDALEEQEIYFSEKIDSIKFFKNGKIQVKFKDSITALEFAREYCGYTK